MSEPSATEAAISFIRRALKERRMTQTQLSKRSGVSQSRISEMLKGTSSPTLETLDRLGSALGVPVSFMLLGASAPLPKVEAPAIEQRLDKEFERLKKAFASCDDRGKRVVLEVARIAAKSRKT